MYSPDVAPRSEALGRSQGGFGTKAVVACDARGRALCFEIVAGQASKLPVAPRLPAAFVGLGVIGRVICDRGYPKAGWRDAIRSAGAEAVVPAHPRHRRVAYDRAGHRRRCRVEHLWGRLKEWRAVSTRYEKTASSYVGALHVAAAVDWIKHG